MLSVFLAHKFVRNILKLEKNSVGIISKSEIKGSDGNAFFRLEIGVLSFALSLNSAY